MVTITNPNIGPVPLPAPLRGLLGGGETALVVSMSKAEVQAIMGTASDEAKSLRISEVADPVSDPSSLPHNPWDTVKTTGNTATTAWSKAIAEGTAYIVRAEIIGRRTDAGGRTAFRIEGLFYRQVGGALTKEGGTFTPNGWAFGIAGAADFALSGNTLLIQVTGVAGQTWRWSVEATFIKAGA